jgi:hypothetical protein
MSLRAEHGSRLKECLALCSSKVRKCSTSRAFVIYLYGISLSYSICLISNPALSVMGLIKIDDHRVLIRFSKSSGSIVEERITTFVVVLKSE